MQKFYVMEMYVFKTHQKRSAILFQVIVLMRPEPWADWFPIAKRNYGATPPADPLTIPPLLSGIKTTHLLGICCNKHLFILILKT